MFYKILKYMSNSKKNYKKIKETERVFFLYFAQNTSRFCIMENMAIAHLVVLWARASDI